MNSKNGDKDLANRLMSMKDQIEKNEKKLERLNGEYDAQLKQLQKDFGVDSVKKAEKLLKQIEGNVQSLQEDLQRGLDKLEQDYEW